MAFINEISNMKLRNKIQLLHVAKKKKRRDTYANVLWSMTICLISSQALVKGTVAEGLYSYMVRTQIFPKT